MLKDEGLSFLLKLEDYKKSDTVRLFEDVESAIYTLSWYVTEGVRERSLNTPRVMVILENFHGHENKIELPRVHHCMIRKNNSKKTTVVLPEAFSVQFFR